MVDPEPVRRGRVEEAWLVGLLRPFDRGSRLWVKRRRKMKMMIGSVVLQTKIELMNL